MHFTRICTDFYATRACSHVIRQSLFLVLFALSLASRAQQVDVQNISIKNWTEPFELKCYKPKVNSPHPTILLLHGREEISVFPRLYQGYIDQLSTEGFEVCTLLYYTEEDKTIMTGNDRALRVQRYHVRLKNWVEKAKQALTVLSERPEVDSSRLGILGFSQGAFVAMGVAASDNRIKAAAEVYGGMPKEFLNTASRLPAVLVLHGNADRVVPVTEAYALEELLKERSVHYRMKIYEGAKHGYDSEPASGIAKDSYRQVVQFFLNELGHGG